jgi:hypothetical protein
MTALEMFEHRIAAACANDEASLFAEAATIFRCPAGRHGFADAAIRLHRALLPGCGFQFGETAARRGLASSWRAGDAHATPFEAATPALALLRATTHAMVRLGETDVRRRCPSCEGRGWTIARDGGKRICRHDAAFNSGLGPTFSGPDPIKKQPHDPVAQQDRAADS